jgi:Carboxypeptidase regulatory-like domain
MNRVRKTRLVIALLALSAVMTGTDCLAAKRSGVVVGTVADNDGGPLPEARVEIVGPSRTPSEKSGGMGFFLFTGLAAGEYTVTVSHPSFSTAVQRVVVRSGETTTMSVQLQGASVRR